MLITKTLIGYVTRQLWLEGHTEGRRVQHKSARESAIYEKLKKGPEFREAIIATIPRKSIVEEVKMLITPTEENRSYHLIVGEHGTGKTSLIELALNSMDKDKPRGIVYIDLPILCGSEIDIAQAMQGALAWSPDPVLDSDKRKYSSSFQLALLRLMDSQRYLYETSWTFFHMLLSNTSRIMRKCRS